MVDYIIEHKYGQAFYAPEDIRLMFQELDAMSLLYPRDGEEGTVDSYVSYRTKYQKYWLEKWLNKYRRMARPENEVLER